MGVFLGHRDGPVAGKGNAACRRDISTTKKEKIKTKFRQNFPVIHFEWYLDSTCVWNSTATFRLMGIRGEYILDVLYKVE
jgi:hypothetical protein